MSFMGSEYLKYLIIASFTCGVTSSFISPEEISHSDGIRMENLGRGVVAVRESSDKVAVSWRYLETDDMNTSFNIYRNGKKIAVVPPQNGTFFTDCYSGNTEVVYIVKPVVNGNELSEKGNSFTLHPDSPVGYINIKLDKPDDGITPAGEKFSYVANDASVGDVDGDGMYEYILKWEPTNAHDNAHDGYTGNVLVDCYKLTGEKLWRIDLGKNIRAGAHYTQFIVYDLDLDGRAEICMKTSDGTIDGTGTVIGDRNADYREKGDPDAPKGGDFGPNDPRGKAKPGDPPRNQGRILTGNEYLTVFDGLTGKALKTVDYVPPRGNLADWGDNRANRSDRFLATVGYFDGRKPSAVFCRGYYTRAVIAAYDWDGKDLSVRWVFDSNDKGNEAYAGQGNHNLRVADVDGDGCHEIVYGSCTIDHDGNGLYSTGMGHGDAMHLTGFIPGSDKLQVWCCHENRKDGSSFRDAATGKVLFQVPMNQDVGRCMAADIDPTNEGVEMFAGYQSKKARPQLNANGNQSLSWMEAADGILNYKGEVIANNISGMSYNMAVWWDGDLLRELLDKNEVSKYDWREKKFDIIKVFEGVEWNNGTKANPCLMGDLVGDWREEVLMRTPDSNYMRLYVTTIPTEYRFHTFLTDPVYRVDIATQNVAYNQPPHTGFYFGPDLEGVFRGYVIKK